jgi:ABC-type sugar transport system ATPase subunit
MSQASQAKSAAPAGGWAVVVRGLRKRFGGVQALRGVDLRVRAGSCHGLVGANGAGKSTLAKILAGVLVPDAGQIQLFGAKVTLSSPAAAERLGVGLVPQEPMLAANLSLAENLALGRERPTRWGTLAKHNERQQAAALLARVGLAHRAPTTPLAELNVAERQLVQVARALGAQARLLILDEPTSALTAQEAAHLFALLRRLQAEGVALIYVSHRLEEVFSLCDSITVLRDGLVAAVFEVPQTTPEQVIEAMAGAAGAQAITAEAGAERLPPPRGPVLLEVRGLSGRGFADVSFAVRSGEVVGLAGLVGAGRSELVRAIAGLEPPRSGQVRLADHPVRFLSAAQAIAQGVVLLPEDRHTQGLVPLLGVRANISLSILAKLAGALGLLNVRRERAVARHYLDRLRIQCADLDQPVRELSGGNQQKVLVARSLACEPRVILLDEPTRGVDVAAKADIHRWIRELAQAGLAVVLISSELQEVAALSHRVLVLRQGRVVAEVAGEQTDEQELLRLAASGGQGQPRASDTG